MGLFSGLTTISPSRNAPVVLLMQLLCSFSQSTLSASTRMLLTSQSDFHKRLYLAAFVKWRRNECRLFQVPESQEFSKGRIVTRPAFVLYNFVRFPLCGVG